MPPVGYVYDPLYLEHATPGHQESPARLQAVVSHLEEAGLLGWLTRIEPRDATTADLEMVHSNDLIARVRVAAERGYAWLDPDTYVVPRSYQAALRAAGGLLAATTTRRWPGPCAPASMRCWGTSSRRTRWARRLPSPGPTSTRCWRRSSGRTGWRKASPAAGA